MSVSRAERIDDVVAVEKIAPGMARVITLSGAYTVDARGEGCSCKDKEFNLDPGEHCKHHLAARIAYNDDLPTPFIVTDNLDRRVVTDGGDVAPRTAIRDAILDGVSAGLDADAVQGVEDVAMSATEAACKNREPLLDFAEYSEVAL